MASTTTGTKKNPYEAVGESILQTALTRARGRHQPYCVGEEPARAYYVSNLSPTHGDNRQEEFVSQIKPSAITLDFKPVIQNGTLSPIAVEFDLYYPSHPTYEEYVAIRERAKRAKEIKQQQAAHISQVEQHEPDTDGGGNSEDEDAANDGGDEEDEDLYVLDESFYRRVTVEYEGSLDLSDPQKAADDFTRGIQKAIQTAIEEETDVHRAVREKPDAEDWPNLDLTDLSADEFDRVVRSLPEVTGDALQWDVRLGVDQRNNEVAIRLMNHPVGEDEEDEGPDEPHVFNPKIEVDARLDKYEFDLLPEDYRFEQHIWAKGRNCSTSVEPLDEANDKYHIETTATPGAEVYEFEFMTDYDTSFKGLAGDVAGTDTIGLLNAIAEGMDDYLGEWMGSRLAKFKREYGEDAPEVDEFKSAAENFREEMNRFIAGIEVLDQEPEILRAFKMMNRVNHRVHWEMQTRDEGFKGWRLFQLVFIVSNIPSIVARDPADKYRRYASEYDDMTDVLWFPTGGGKTEAYVGLVLFNLFFDRMRGKHNGVTAWIRFPLRLLSRQQKQRFMKAMLVAEDIRSDPEDDGGLGSKGRPFSLGYFPGSQDSPNAIGGRNNLDETFAAAVSSERAREQLEETCKHLEECPLCGSEISVRYDETANSVYHHCTGNELPQDEDCIEQIPFYVVDRDIYRYTPSVLLGSLDKIAVMGMQPRFTNLLGNFTTRCPIHGLGYSDNCPEKQVCEFDPGSDEFEDVTPGTRDPAKRGEVEYFDPIPTLHLVDEVHLLSEELGAFSSHYETTFLSLCERIGGATPKVLTSTATISEYERQIENLFQQNATRFPEEGPTLGETFYGELNEEKTERAYHGLTPNNRTHLYAVLDLIKQYHEVIRDYYRETPAELARTIVKGYHERNPESSTLDPADKDDLDKLMDRSGWATSFDADEKAAILELYETSLVYFTNKREKDTYRKNIGKQIHDEMVEDGYETPLEHQQLTADTEDTGILDRLEDPEPDWRERIDTVPATSFVGHGIDVPRFNFMTFFGYPSQTFQYIQASSRVGRQEDKPGHVLDVFRPFDKRDRHRYKYFGKLHEYLSRTVEPVPIDRWAKFAIEETFSGVYMSILLQYYRPLLFRKRDADGNPMTITTSGRTQRVNLQNAGHLYEAMNNDHRFPELTKATMHEQLSEAFALDNSFYTSEYFENQVDVKLDNIWRFWNDRLSEEMDFPEWPDGEEPMINLRDIGTSGDITAFTDQLDFVEALTEG